MFNYLLNTGVPKKIDLKINYYFLHHFSLRLLVFSVFEHLITKTYE
jgi:hypothetical protein